MTKLKQLSEDLRIANKRVKELESLINNPELDNFLEGLKIESAHQTEKWGLEREDSAYPHHYSLVLDKLKGKQALAIWDQKTDKYKHHLITMAAVCFNAFRQVHKKGTSINAYFKADVLSNNSKDDEE